MRGDHANAPRPLGVGERMVATPTALLPERDITPPEQTNA
jgi:hypothetical protein